MATKEMKVLLVSTGAMVVLGLIGVVKALVRMSHGVHDDSLNDVIAKHLEIGAFITVMLMGVWGVWKNTRSGSEEESIELLEVVTSD